MKIKTSMKICNNFKKVWRCGYCDLQYIFSRDDATYYNCGVYGWNCDLYVDYEHDAIITTGYRNMRGERIPSELIEKYNALAAACRWDESEKREQIKRDFLAELSRM